MLRSIGAVLAGLVAVFVLSLGTDQVLHVLQVYPPWGQPMYDPGLNLLALSYRIVIGILGGYVTARAAAQAPMAHALALGIVGLALSTAGGVAMQNLSPPWYPLALALTAVPCAWLGGMLHRRSDRAQLGFESS